MDSVIFQAMAVELNRKLTNSRLDRVIQVAAGTLVLRFWTGREKLQLLLKADGQGCFYQTRFTHAAPAKPPRFCQLLRARLRRLVEVQAEPLDRILHLRFSGEDNQRYDLILEAFGAQGNLILTDAAGRIVDLLRRQDGTRTLLPGAPYLLPEQLPRTSLFGDRAELLRLLASAADAQALAQLAIAPMSPALARAICLERSAGVPDGEILDRIRQAFSAGRFEALRVSWDGRTGLLPLSLGRSGFSSIEACADLSALLEETPATVTGPAAAGDLAVRLAGLVAGQRKKLAKRFENIAAESDRQADPDKFRIMGDLLLASLRLIKRGAETVEVDDYYQSPPAKVCIPLNGRLSGQDNAGLYFKKYRKAKRAGEHLQRRRQETEQELAWLDEVALALDEAQSGDDLYQVQLELEAAGLIKAVKGQLGRRQLPRPEDQLHRATTPGGRAVLWGRNSRSNDYVSQRLTAPDDLWFHAHRMPGCHLVLKCAGQGDVPHADLLYAAAMAAGYSQGKSSAKVEVMVAKGRDVRKPKGARPGLVTVDAYRTVMVAPLRLDD